MKTGKFDLKIKINFNVIKLDVIKLHSMFKIDFLNGFELAKCYEKKNLI